MRSLLASLRRNAVAYTALVVALVGMPSAYAVATIRSADIVDGEVKAVDLGSNAVRSPKILDGEVHAEDLGANSVRGTKVLDRSISNQDLSSDSVNADKVVDGSLGGTEISDGSVTGYDVNESTLGTVPSAYQAGLGRADPAGSCDPESYTFVACSTASITLSQPGRLFVIATVRAYAESGAGRFVGDCRLSTSVGGAIESTRDVVDGDEGGDDFYDNMTLHTITGVLPAGTVYVGVECNDDGLGEIKYDLARVSVVGLSAG